VGDDGWVRGVLGYGGHFPGRQRRQRRGRRADAGVPIQFVGFVCVFERRVRRGLRIERRLDVERRLAGVRVERWLVELCVEQRRVEQRRFDQQRFEQRKLER
jgi:hypothetical protein